MKEMLRKSGDRHYAYGSARATNKIKNNMFMSRSQEERANTKQFL